MLKLDQSHHSLDFLNNRIRHVEKEILNRTAALFNADAESILNAPYSNVCPPPATPIENFQLEISKLGKCVRMSSRSRNL